MSQLSVDSVDKQSGSTLTLGGAGTTVQPHASATVSGFLPSSISTSGDDFQFNSGYGSVATAYGCRAWVKFNGTGTVAIYASGNVSSITDNGTGDYTVNFTIAMSDANYAVTAASFLNSTVGSVIAVFDYTTSSARIKTSTHNAGGGSFQDQNPISAVVVR